MQVETRNINVSEIINSDVPDLVDDVRSLCPGCEADPIIVCPDGKGGYEIVDGYHRTAGMARYLDGDDAEITVVYVDGENDERIAAASDPFCGRHVAAIEEIYELAGVAV